MLFCLLFLLVFFVIIIHSLVMYLYLYVDRVVFSLSLETLAFLSTSVWRTNENFRFDSTYVYACMIRRNQAIIELIVCWFLCSLAAAFHTFDLLAYKFFAFYQTSEILSLGHYYYYELYSRRLSLFDLRTQILPSSCLCISGFRWAASSSCIKI